MTEKSFMTVEEVAEELRVSKSKAYEIVRQLNAELRQKGYLTVAGRVNTRFFQKKTCYSEQERSRCNWRFIKTMPPEHGG